MAKRMRATALAMVLAVVGGLMSGVPAAVVASAPAGAALTGTDLSSGVTATQLAQSLAGAGVTVSNVTYAGAPIAAGSFSGAGSGAGSIGFDTGIVLSSGRVAGTSAVCNSKGVEGPNICSSNSTSNGTPGDTALTALAGVATNDAAILQFDFVPQFATVQFEYVFGSEEYLEYVNAGVNDVFGFFVNGVNCATIPGTAGTPVSIDTVNTGTNPSFFRNNATATIDTELDGITTVLACNATVTPGVANTLRLAIADGGDTVLDSGVFIRAGSLVSGTSISGTLTDGEVTASTLTVQPGTPVSANATLSGVNSATATGTVTYTAYTDDSCDGTAFAGGSKIVTAGVVPGSDPFAAVDPGSYYWQAAYSGDGLNNASSTTCGDLVQTVQGVPVSPFAITLAPSTSSGPVGSTYTATATVTRDGVRQSGVDVTFVITSGPNGETSSSAVTNADGVAELSYISELAGTDTLFARVIDGETPVDSNSVTREWTPVAPTDLTITSEGQPDAVTAGASALRIITVTNPGEGTAEDVSISFTLAPGTTLVRTTPSQGTCGPVVEGTVTCELGDLAGGASANVRFVVSTPAVIPPGGTITTSATAQEGDGTPVGPAQSTTTLTPPTPGAASGYVPPGGTLTTGGDATPGNDTVASLTLPNSGDGAVVTLTSVPCAPGVCFGKTVTFNDFPGYDDPTKPIRFTTLYDKSVRGTGLFSQLYVLKDTDTQFRFIPPCTKPGEKKLLALARYLSGLLVGGRSGVAVPSPCVNKKEQLKNGDLRYETLFTSGDPGVRRR